MLKVCSVCNENKKLNLFAKDSKTKSGYRNRCKDCYNKRHKELLLKRGGGLGDHLKSRYGITLDTYNLMLKEQKNCCAICNKHTDSLRRRLSVDHDHETGEVRKLLCDHCNTALGLVQENEEIIISMLSYLKEFKHGT
jgi:hypothetical protein